MLGGHTLQRASPLTADAAALQVFELSLCRLYLPISPQVFELFLSAPPLPYISLYLRTS